MYRIESYADIHEISQAVEMAAEVLGAKRQDMEKYVVDARDWDANTPEELANLIIACWREQVVG